MRNIIAIVLVFMISMTLYSKEITLELCYENLEQNYPLLKQKKSFAMIEKLQDEIISNAWMPKLNLNAQATYQSDITKVDVTMPQIEVPGMGQLNIPDLDIPTPAKDQYKISLDISQMIYDGGISSASSDLNQLNTKLSSQAIDVEIDKVKKQINTLFFTKIILQKKVELLNKTIETINQKKSVLQSLVKNGMLLQSELDYLEAELIKIKQSLIDLKYTQKNIINSLNLMTNLNITENDVFNMPNEKNALNKEAETPQHKLFQIQESLSEAGKDINGSKVKPKIFAFAQTGYGRPGLNMLSDEFDTFYILGVKFSWNIWDWNSSSKENETLELKKEIISSTRETYNKSLNIALDKEENEQAKLREIISKDEEIIKLKERITKTASSKLDNGVITSSVYMESLNEEIKAMLNLESHKIQLMKSIINYNTLLGN